MNKQHLTQLIHTAIEKSGIRASIDTLPSIQVDATRDKQHGDYATNIALLLAKPLKQSPREVAALIINALPIDPAVKKVDIAGPGFINFFLVSDAISRIVKDVLTAGQNFGHADIGKNKRVIVEFVSSNPTGPLHVGHGRHGAYGAIVSDLLAAIGYDVHREYYINDAGRQMDIVAVSVWLRYLSLCGEQIIFPANAYQGDYIIEIARELHTLHGNTLSVPAAAVFRDLPLDEPQGGDKELYIDAMITRAKQTAGESNFDIVFDYALNSILANMSEDLAEFGVNYQKWFSERDFARTDAVNRTIQLLKDKQLTYEHEGALWFRATSFNDEKDRVLERSNGVRTYFANDLAYHVNKFERGFDLAINIFGADHHGYVPRVQAGLRACGVDEQKWICRTLQFVTLYRGNQQVQMSTRSGSFVTLRELRNEVGNDAARYFYVMRKSEQPIDFDLDLAKSQSSENPVYYIQYAHARICSVFRQLKDKNLTYDEANGLAHLNLLDTAHELQLLSTLARYSDVILNAAQHYEPQILTNYLRELANDFHVYYNAHQFLVDHAELRNARLALITATRQILINGLKLLGVSAPESM